MKKKSHFIFFSLKHHLIPMLLIIFTIGLVIFSRENLSATKTGLLLWANSVLPSLFPFFIATELLSRTDIVTQIGKLLHKWMKPIFNVPGIGAYAFIMGIISGYPIGAKIVTGFRNQGLCTKAEGERLLAFTNNSGPLFILGTVGISLFFDTRIGILLFLTHILSCILVGFIFRFWKYRDREKLLLTQSTTSSRTQTLCFSNLGEALASSITSATQTVMMIGGFVVLFSVILSILEHSGFFIACTSVLSPLFHALHINPDFIHPLISGMLELTNGINLISHIPEKQISINIVFTAFLLGFGGISVLLQVLSITSKSDLSIKSYFYGKLLQGGIAAILTYIFIHIFPIFNLDITPIFSANVNRISLLSSYSNWGGLTILISILCFSLFLCLRKKKSVNG